MRAWRRYRYTAVYGRIYTFSRAPLRLTLRLPPARHRVHCISALPGALPQTIAKLGRSLLTGPSFSDRPSPLASDYVAARGMLRPTTAARYPSITTIHYRQNASAQRVGQPPRASEARTPTKPDCAYTTGWQSSTFASTDLGTGRLDHHHHLVLQGASIVSSHNASTPS